MRTDRLKSDEKETQIMVKDLAELSAKAHDLYND
jgi:hypothetical protein